MNIDIEQLAKEEVHRLVKEKINGKLHLQIQKELKEHNYTHMIRNFVHDEMESLLKDIKLLDYIDKDKLQKDVTGNISTILLDRISTSHDHEEY